MEITDESSVTLMQRVKLQAEAFDLNVTGCRFAEFFRALGEPELGAILTFELDDHVAELGAPAVTLSRSDTLM